MSGFAVFLIRLVLSMAFSVILTRLFYPEKNVIFIAVLGALLVSLAYIVSLFRTKDVNNQGDSGR